MYSYYIWPNEDAVGMRHVHNVRPTTHSVRERARETGGQTFEIKSIPTSRRAAAPVCPQANTQTHTLTLKGFPPDADDDVVERKQISPCCRSQPDFQPARQRASQPASQNVRRAHRSTSYSTLRIFYTY